MGATTNTFADLADWLLDEATVVHMAQTEHGNADLCGTDSTPGPLIAALDLIGHGDLIGALKYLDDVIALAAKPVEPPTTGRSRPERHLAATHQRKSIGRTAQIARVLVLDAIKVQGGAV
jgi:hypothetical protein